VKTYVNPRPIPLRLVFSDGTESIVKPYGAIQTDLLLLRADVVPRSTDEGQACQQRAEL